MRLRKIWRYIEGLALCALLLYLATWYQAPRASAQATTGYTLLASTDAATLTYTDSTCPAGSSCSYEVTAYDATGESAPAMTAGGATSITLAPGPKGQIVLTWVAPTTGAAPTGYHVYTAGRVPNPPTALAAASD